MATPTLPNRPRSHCLITAAVRVVGPSNRPTSKPSFRVFPTGEAEHHWRIAASATNQTISLHKSLSFALKKCNRPNSRTGKGAKHANK